MYSIDVDYDVYRELIIRRKNEATSVSDVLRELLGLARAPQPVTQGRKNPWVTKGATFPHGTQFRGIHRGQWHNGEVDDAAFLVAGTRFRSLSAAATQIRGFSEDGWRFWEVRLPDSPEWKSLKDWPRERRAG
jgi:hypothetical protein